jgi:predicted N-acetyltransferase YhbS
MTSHQGDAVIVGRELQRQEIARVWSIDRSEVVEHIYVLTGGKLTLEPYHLDAPGWPPGEAQIYTPLLLDCFDRGGWFYGLFVQGQLIGVAVLESKFIGPRHDQLQLKFLHVDRAYRDQGLGRRLFALACEVARRNRAHSLYISATPSQHTIDFYLRLGCQLARQPDPELLALEPEDIHLEYALEGSGES